MKEGVEFEWVFSHIDLFDWDQCDGEFHERYLFFKEHSIVVYECDKCQEMRTLEKLQIAAAEVYVHDWESKCKREVEREDDCAAYHESDWEQIQSYGGIII